MQCSLVAVRFHTCSKSQQKYVVQMCCGCRTVTDPYLSLFRGIIPPLGGTLDLSPILAFVCLNVSAQLPTSNLLQS
jgi:uncharacterized protein YggT (Ycf19 family)